MGRFCFPDSRGFYPGKPCHKAWRRFCYASCMLIWLGFAPHQMPVPPLVRAPLHRLALCCWRALLRPLQHAAVLGAR